MTRSNSIREIRFSSLMLLLSMALGVSSCGFIPVESGTINIRVQNQTNCWACISLHADAYDVVPQVLIPSGQETVLQTNTTLAGVKVRDFMFEPDLRLTAKTDSCGCSEISWKDLGAAATDHLEFAVQLRDDFLILTEEGLFPVYSTSQQEFDDFHLSCQGAQDRLPGSPPAAGASSRTQPPDKPRQDTGEE